MKTLIVYYSRTGSCKSLATTISEAMNSDCERLLDVHPYRGPLGFLRGCFVAVRKMLTNICPPQFQPREYDQVILITPIWVGRAAPAIRNYVDQYSDMCRKLKLFVVGMKHDTEGRVSDDLQSSFGLNIDNTVLFTSSEIRKGDVLERLKSMSAK